MTPPSGTHTLVWLPPTRYQGWSGPPTACGRCEGISLTSEAGHKWRCSFVLLSPSLLSLALGEASRRVVGSPAGPHCGETLKPPANSHVELGTNLPALLSHPQFPALANSFTYGFHEKPRERAE